MGSLSIDDRLVGALAAIGVGTLAAVALIHTDPETLKRVSEIALSEYSEKYMANCEFGSLDKVPRIDGEYGLDFVDSDLPIINPNKGQFGEYNCEFCVSALAMRVKGYDVVAAGADASLPPTLTTDFFKGAKISALGASGYKNIFEKLSAEGEGSYGSLGVYKNSKNAPGHNLFWMVKDGRVRILDPQKNKEYSEVSIRELKINPSQCIFSNLTECEPTNYVVGALKSR